MLFRLAILMFIHSSNQRKRWLKNFSRDHINFIKSNVEKVKSESKAWVTGYDFNFSIIQVGLIPLFPCLPAPMHALFLMTPLIVDFSLTMLRFYGTSLFKWRASLSFAMERTGLVSALLGSGAELKSSVPSAPLFALPLKRGIRECSLKILKIYIAVACRCILKGWNFQS